MEDKARLLDTLSGRQKGLLPVVCPGGMMSAVCREVGLKNSDAWPDGHIKPDVMAQVALEIMEATGFENLGVPFCVTVEAEALGAKVDLGDATVEPQIAGYLMNSQRSLPRLDINHIERNGRVPVVLDAISYLKQRHPGVPVIGNLTGPMSLAASLMDPNLLFRYMVKDKPFVRELIACCSETIAAFGEAQAKAGADVVSIGDPTASGEILGPELFEEFELDSLRTVVRRIRRQNAMTIVHICGNVESILRLLPSTEANAFSFDAKTAVRTVREQVGNWVLMGNVSTYLLAWGSASAIANNARRVINEGIDIVSPACGLATGTAAANMRALTDAVRKVRSATEGS